MVYAIKVSKENAEKTKKTLLKRKLLDTTHTIIEKDGFVIFPINRKINGSVEYYLPKREKKLNPYEKVKKIIGENINIPDYWEKIGDIIILPPFKNYSVHSDIIGEAFSEVFKVKTVIIYKGTFGEFRRPNIEIIYGKDTETIHIENKIKYKLDVKNIMFSSGNINERIRMSKIDVKNEIIVDLFAGIGYFSLPLAKYGKPNKIYACEKNPIALRYLIENIKLNHLTNIIPILGDNRKTAPLKIADRVLMGYIKTDRFLNLGFKVLKPKGGIIHYHDTFTTEEKKWKPEENLKRYGKKNNFSIKILRKKIIKSYAPHIWHIVVDAKAMPKN